MVTIDWLKLVLKNPRGGLDRLAGLLDRRGDKREWRRLGIAPRDLYGARADAHQQLHSLICAPWPCPQEADFQHLAANSDLEQAPPPQLRGIEGTRAAQSVLLSERFDVDFAVLRAIWCVILHLKASRIVETGVARGVTSRFILEALARNGEGSLWSIDLPHVDTSRLGQIGEAVPEALRKHWMLTLGSSRQHLPPLLKRLKEIDVFVHDSLHTGRNLLFELEHAWKRLRPGGVVIADDIHRNLAFKSFVAALDTAQLVVGERSERGGLWGVIVKA